MFRSVIHPLQLAAPLPSNRAASEFIESVVSEKQRRKPVPDSKQSPKKKI